MLERGKEGNERVEDGVEDMAVDVQRSMLAAVLPGWLDCRCAETTDGDGDNGDERIESTCL